MQEKTPLMQQYEQIKREYQDVLVLFQVGDFYELFYDDAVKVSSMLGITLTSRGKSKNGTVPLCGFPVHTLDFYVKKLLDYGVKVAICNQLTEPKPGTISERGVVRVFTPGTLVDNNLLVDKSNSYLASIFKKDDSVVLMFLELLTGVIQYTVFASDAKKTLETELFRFSPDEILASTEMRELIASTSFSQSVFSEVRKDVGEQLFSIWFTKQEFVCKKMEYSALVTLALKQIYNHLSYAYKQSLDQKYSLVFYKPEQYVMLDGVTIRNLDLVSQNKQTKATLFSVLDECVTPMGSRLLKKWILFPLNNQLLIEKRLKIVRFFFKHYQLLQRLRELLLTLGDVERLIGRISLKKDAPADYQKLLEILSVVPEFLTLVEPIIQGEQIIPVSRVAQCRVLEQLRLLLVSSINTEEHNDVIIKKGYNQDLDHMRSLLHNVKVSILALETQEQQKTGINSLKIRYTPLHGYSIEITHNHLDKVPKEYRRLQTLSGKERYTNNQLEELQQEIHLATINVDTLEKELFESIREETHRLLPLLRTISFLFSYFDVVTTFSHLAKERRYVEPELGDSGEITIVGGRHPVVERLLQQRFVANNTTLNDQQFFMVLTGPNMGGKSTYLRQVALICIMAHIGSFVPAISAKIMVLDRIFTRIGAGDNISEGKSTFLVEMEEVATICLYATQSSLVILDEVGRGTASKDGISIAQAILEYLCVTLKPRCLFATHYHELATLNSVYPVIVPYRVTTKKVAETVVFLYSVTPGVAENSFGIEVAKMTKLPNSIISRALILLDQQEGIKQQKTRVEDSCCSKYDAMTIKYVKKAEIIESLNVNELTPKQALDILFQLTSL